MSHVRAGPCLKGMNTVLRAALVCGVLGLAGCGPIPEPLLCILEHRCLPDGGPVVTEPPDAGPTACQWGSCSQVEEGRLVCAEFTTVDVGYQCLAGCWVETYNAGCRTPVQTPDTGPTCLASCAGSEQGRLQCDAVTGQGYQCWYGCWVAYGNCATITDPPYDGGPGPELPPDGGCGSPVVYDEDAGQWTYDAGISGP